MVASFRDSLDSVARAHPARRPLRSRAAPAGTPRSCRPAVQARIARAARRARAPSSCASSSSRSIRRGRASCCSRARSIAPIRRAACRSSAPPLRRRRGRAAAGRGSTRRQPISTGSRRGRSSRCRSTESACAFTVAGVWRDYGRQQGAIAIERERYVELTGDAHRDQRRAVARDPAPTASAVEAAFAATIPGGDRLEIVLARRHPRRCRCRSSTARSRSPMRWSSPPSSSASSDCRRRSARSCSRAGANSACCATSA